MSHSHEGYSRGHSRQHQVQCETIERHPCSDKDKPHYQKRYNLKPIYRGDSLLFPKFVFDFQDDLTIEITSQHQQIKNDDGDVIHDAIMIVDGYTVSAQPIDTQGIEPGVYKYDLQVFLSNGVTRTYVFGTVTLVQDITDIL